VHVPRVPARLQATHAPEQAASQHTPSTQRPERHSQAAPQVAPSPFFAAQPLPEQKAAAESHCVAAHAPEQVVLHAPAPLHAYTPQPPSGSPPDAWFLHVPTEPAALHDAHGPAHARLQHTPSAH
jgi:hypothetical protein